MPTIRARLISKYHARPCVVDGIRFDSVKESKRYGELKILEKVGQIRSLRLQPTFVIMVNSIVCAKYRADFDYYDVATETRVIEDAKGFPTPVYRLKKRLVEAIYGIQIQEV